MLMICRAVALSGNILIWCYLLSRWFKPMLKHFWMFEKWNPPFVLVYGDTIVILAIFNICVITFILVAAISYKDNWLFNNLSCSIFALFLILCSYLSGAVGIIVNI